MDNCYRLLERHCKFLGLNLEDIGLSGNHILIIYASCKDWPLIQSDGYSDAQSAAYEILYRIMHHSQNTREVHDIDLLSDSITNLPIDFSSLDELDMKLSIAGF